MGDRATADGTRSGDTATTNYWQLPWPPIHVLPHNDIGT